MLTPRLTECLECADISALLSEIDCKLTDLAKAEYNNLVFSLNRPIQGILISDLLTYKRILTNRLCNPDYACTYPLNQIASRVKTLHPIQCKPDCQEKDFRFYNPVSNVYPPTTIPPPSTTSTSSSSSTSTSSSSTTITTTIHGPGSYQDVGSICLEIVNNSCDYFLECNNYYYDKITCPNLTTGCTLYNDVNLTSPVVGIPSKYYSNGVVSYQINSSGIIVSEEICPVPPPPPPRYQHCSSFVNIKLDGTPFDVEGVTVTCTYTGDVRNYPSPDPYEVRGTLDIIQPTPIWIGRDWSTFTLTLNFSQPISSINIYQCGGDLSENYKFSTNSGTPTLTAHYISRATIQGDTLVVNPNVYFGQANALLIVSNSTPFTSLTISGYNTPPGRPFNSWGSVFSICTQLV